MDYPRDFPEHLKSGVDAAIHAAEIKFIDAKKTVSESRFEIVAEQLILRYVEAVFFGFAKQAVQAGKEGVWNGERIRKALEDFLEHAGRRAYFDKHPNPAAYYGTQRFTDALTKASKDWVGWRAIHQGLKEVAELRDLPAGTAVAAVPAHKEGTLSLAYRLDEAVAGLDITHEELARRIGVGKTTYFAVKGGGGKRSTQIKVEEYLRKLNKSNA